MKWKFDNIPDQTDRIAIVTGANAGIGFSAARALVAKGARVILACRSEERGTDALERINADELPGSAELRILDLSDLESVRSFATAFAADNERLDLLINNAGVMVPPSPRPPTASSSRSGSTSSATTRSPGCSSSCSRRRRARGW